MNVFRVSATKYSRDLSGKGAEINGGRWNHKLTACVYAAESRALAVLEYAVNIELDRIPRALSISEIHIPDEHILRMEEKLLPGDWRNLKAPRSTKDFLRTYLSPQGAVAIRIPSVVIPREYNYVLNPRHQSFSQVKISSVADFSFDIRIK